MGKGSAGIFDEAFRGSGIKEYWNIGIRE